MSALRSAWNGNVCICEVGSFDWAEAVLADTGRLTPEQVALVLERNPDTPLRGLHGGSPRRDPVALSAGTA